MSDSDHPIIEEREDGPLVVTGIRSMTGAQGAAMDVKPVMALCRCGESKNKPYCDGSHKDAGFQSRGGTPAGRDWLISYEGSDVTVTYNPLLCSHAAECGRLASHIFNPAQQPWVQPDNGTRPEVEAVVAACPSGALALDGPKHMYADRTEITIERNGPYWVNGVELAESSLAEGASGRKYVLCRCGMSGNKPNCDGTHRDAGWKSDD